MKNKFLVSYEDLSIEFVQIWFLPTLMSCCFLHLYKRNFPRWASFQLKLNSAKWSSFFLSACACCFVQLSLARKIWKTSKVIIWEIFFLRLAWCDLQFFNQSTGSEVEPLYEPVQAYEKDKSGDENVNAKIGILGVRISTKTTTITTTSTTSLAPTTTCSVSSSSCQINVPKAGTTSFTCTTSAICATLKP